MKIKTSRRRRSPEEWREILGRQAESNLSVEKFCRRESISVNVFRRWRTKLAAAPLPIRSGFVELKSAAVAACESVVRVELQLPNGAILRIA